MKKRRFKYLTKEEIEAKAKKEHTSIARQEQIQLAVKEREEAMRKYYPDISEREIQEERDLWMEIEERDPSGWVSDREMQEEMDRMKEEKKMEEEKKMKEEKKMEDEERCPSFKFKWYNGHELLTSDMDDGEILKKRSNKMEEEKTIKEEKKMEEEKEYCEKDLVTVLKEFRLFNDDERDKFWSDFFKLASAKEDPIDMTSGKLKDIHSELIPLICDATNKRREKQTEEESKYVKLMKKFREYDNGEFLERMKGFYNYTEVESYAFWDEYSRRFPDKNKDLVDMSYDELAAEFHMDATTRNYWEAHQAMSKKIMDVFPDLKSEEITLSAHLYLEYSKYALNNRSGKTKEKMYSPGQLKSDTKEKMSRLEQSKPCALDMLFDHFVFVQRHTFDDGYIVAYIRLLENKISREVPYVDDMLKESAVWVRTMIGHFALRLKKYEDKLKDLINKREEKKAEELKAKAAEISKDEIKNKKGENK